jgi:fermentation-respiration switch protein FrsA (DUF1100 family)
MPIESTRTYTTAVTYQTYDGTVPGLFYAPPAPGPFPCVISRHGVTSNKGSSIGLRGHGPGAAESHRIGYTVVGFLDQYLKTP